MRLALCLTLAVLTACSGARPAVELGRDEHSSVTPGAPASANLVAPPTPPPTNNAPYEMELRCATREGDPRTWHESPPSDCDHYDMQAEYSFCKWDVQKDEQGIRAISKWRRTYDSIALPFRPSFIPKHAFAVCAGEIVDESRLPEQRVRALAELESGFLVGYNSGEWGGGLYWYARDGALVQRVLDENVVRIVPMGRRALVFTGIAHLVMDEGQATLLELDGGTWNVVHSLDLAGAPDAFLDEDDGSILVVSGARLVRVSNASKVEILHRASYDFWGPTSMVRGADGDLYIGSMYVVVRLRPLAVGYAESWLAPTGATRPRPAEGSGG